MLGGRGGVLVIHRIVVAVDKLSVFLKRIKWPFESFGIRGMAWNHILDSCATPVEITLSSLKETIVLRLAKLRLFQRRMYFAMIPITWDRV